MLNVEEIAPFHDFISTEIKDFSFSSISKVIF